ncbi:MAG: type II toxin-antitoxin system prevent-host-death family antitoxin [Thiobacillaceae bacterium]|nr:type II toxin-antitoxin system prevent-host-death family antitoxin [Thiobacillaceae bacterium]MDW8324879.1 type II toxin-antitoxin system prevent-host-death family antitoxin [Burkholderiales bacterium]
MQVSIRELKVHLSRYVRLARTGEVIEVTAHRRPVARVIGVPSSRSSVVPSSAQGSALQALIARGGTQWGGGKPQGARLTLAAGGTALSRIVLEERG